MTAPSRIGQRRISRENLWRLRAEKLLERWRQASREVYRAGCSTERRAALDVLGMLRERRRALVEEVRREGRPTMIRWLEQQLAGLDRRMMPS